MAKRFIKESGQADSYQNLEIKFISGRNPDLIIQNDNGLHLERIDLTSFDSLEALHAMMEEKGNRPRD